MSTHCVIGGGLSGLEFAIHSASRGNRVVVYEAGPSLRRKHVHADTRVIEGDAKKAYWKADEKWAIGGISERLGGRSLCYHGVMLPIEARALEDWPVEWRARLAGSQGMYRDLQREFTNDYPEMIRREPIRASLLHVPQAATVSADGAFSAYSPLSQVEALVHDGVIRIERAAVAKVEKTLNGFRLIDRQGQKLEHEPFHKCVLSASAIMNNEIISTSLERSTTADVTDHYCVGIAVRTNVGERIGKFRHEMVWHGFSEHLDLNANIFVVERPNLASGDRLILFMAVIEQNPDFGDLSKLICHFSSGRTTLEIISNFSDLEVANYNRISKRIVDFARDKLDTDLAPQFNTSAERAGKFFESREIAGLDSALDALDQARESNVYARFAFPYGSYEHESCTHPIGGKGDIALTDALEVTTMPGVYAVGPGAFPRLGVANPALTICSLSRWLASQI